jgi:hypothetical protein
MIILYLLFFNNNNNKITNKHYYELFANQDNTKLGDGYLYPIKGLTPICANEGLKASYMPKACYVDGKLNSYANCKCEDKDGNCKICYDTIVKDSKNSSVVYNANDLNNWS